MKYQWQIKKEEFNDIIHALLENRGIVNKDDKERFLNPDWEEHTYDPWSFKQMKDAVQRVFFGMEKGQKIMIHGDYDADGVSGAVIIYNTLSEIRSELNLNFEIGVFLPDREKDGYGVAMHTIERFGRTNVRLLITVDCGISNFKELNRAHEIGIDSIICDHHQLADELPVNSLIIHPLAPGETYPNKHLCGAGVAFKFASALIHEAQKHGANFPNGHEKWLLDLVAIATVTDVMPLLGENRVLEKFGLKVLNKTKRQGIRKIIDYSRSEIGKLDTQAIGFQLGPRINAAGRIKSAKIAFEALASEFAEEADYYAAQLEMINRERQNISNQAFKEAEEMILDDPDSSIIVVKSDVWHPGIVGLIAGKLVTKYGKPAFAITKSNGQLVGSGRSTGGLNLVEAMQSCGLIFIKSGGHPEACGLSMIEENLKLFKKSINSFAKDFFKGGELSSKLEIDLLIDLDDINWDLIKKVNCFAPFGQGNKRPCFISKKVTILSASAVGKTKDHLKIRINRTKEKVIDGIGFGLGAQAEDLLPGDIIDIVYELNINEWNGNESIQLFILDIKKS